MKLFKKVLAASLASAMVLSLTACGSSDDTASSADTSSSAAETTAEAVTEAATAAASTGEKLTIKLCLSTFSDNSFQQSAYEGAMQLQEDYPDQVEVNAIEMGTDDTTWKDAFYEAGDEGYDIIIGTGYQNAETFAELPLEYPDSKWILFDQSLDFSAGDLTNVLSVVFDSSQSGYMAGAAAAYYTKTGTIGFIGGKDSVTINEFMVGYIEGAQSVNSDIKVLTAYNGSYTDTANAKSLAEAQIADDADVIFQCAGGSGNGVIEACSEADGVEAIGVDADQSVTLAGTGYESVVMTSALKNLGTVLQAQIVNYMNDPTSVPFGSQMEAGFDMDGVGIVYNDQLTAAIGDDNVAALKETQSGLADGSITCDSATDMTAEEITALVDSVNK